MAPRAGRPAAQEPGPAPPTRAAFFARQAGEAFAAGQAALVAGDRARARRWFERATRIAPDDVAAALALAGVLMRDGAATEALALLDRDGVRGASREALLLLAAARMQAGDRPGAAAVLGSALSRHAGSASVELAPFAAAAALAAGAPGWCGVASAGRLIAAATGPLQCMLDGRQVPKVPELVDGLAGEALAITCGGQHLLGSPIDLAAQRRVEGVVAAIDGGLEGWAWHPGDVDRDPMLQVVDAAGRAGPSLTAVDQDVVAERPLAQPRRFRLPADRLAGLQPPLRLLGGGGDLAGSPVDPGRDLVAAAVSAGAVARRFPLRLPAAAAAATAAADLPVPAALRGRPANAPAAPDRPVAVVVPVFRDLATTQRCLAAVRATVPAETVVVVVDDASPEPALSAWLVAERRSGRLRVLRNRSNLGFPASANAGLRAAARAAGGADIVLLNSDTLPAPGWIEALRRAVHGAGDIGSASPLSNDAAILSYPDPAGGNPAPEGAALARLARLAVRANPSTVVEVPTTVGFCMYIRRECLGAVGLFREDLFAQGYGEENDFCLRARHLGWRHVAVPGAYVAHLGGRSFGAATAPLLARNLAVLERMHPGYRALIAEFEAADPLGPARRHFDAARWRAGRRRAAAGAVLLVTHDSGGGVERVVAQRAAAARAEGRRAIVLRPVPDRMRPGPGGGVGHLPGLCRVEDSADPGAQPNLVFSLPRELGALAGLLRGDQPARLEVHHLLGHHRAVLRLGELLGLDADFHVHDYAAFCPRVTLFGPERRYCGEPSDPRDCDACVADAGPAIEEEISVAALRARSRRELAMAQRVVVPSVDTAQRLRRHFPELAPEIAAHEADPAKLPAAAAAADGRRLVCVIGGIGPEKGYDVLLACARDAARRELNLAFVLVGHSPDDRRLLDTGRVFVTGPYAEGEGEALVRAQAAHLAWLPSLWPETWCFTLGVAWRAGLRVAVFDIGAQAERVRATGHGWVLPLGLPAAAINNALLAVNP